MKLMKGLLSAFAVVLATTACAGNSGENKKSNESTKEDNKMEVVALNKADFLKKVYNYEASPNDWKFEGSRPAIVDFYATWCGPCKVMHPILEELSKEYSGKVDIYQIDVDKEQDLAAAFGIRSIPTLLMIPMKEEPRIMQGAMPKDQLKKAIDEFRKNVLEKIETYEYEQKLIALFDTVELKIIRKRFNERYKVLVQNSDYARCFVSSEWYYDIQEKTNNGLEQTAVVAGDFKAVEQLLFEIIKLSMREQKITIEALRIKRKEDEKKYIPLITDNLNRVNKMLNSLINCINYPKNQLFVVDTKIKEKVICFITEYKNKNRNQYFHNDNLYSWEKIKEIREKTYEILFLILGCLKIDEDKIDLLGKGDIIFEEPVVEELTYQLFANWVEKLMRFNNLSDYNVIIFEFKKDGSSKNKYRLGVRTRDFYVDNGYGMKVEDPLSDLLPHYRTMLEWKSEKSIDDVEMKVKKIVEEYLKKGKNAGVLLERDVIAVGRWEHFECLHKK